MNKQFYTYFSLLLLAFGLFFSSKVAAKTNLCFLAKENGQILKKIGDTGTPYSPESTFKIALSLMGFDYGILKNESEPSWSLPDKVDLYIVLRNVCKKDQTPRTWIRDNCFWYSKILTTQLGMEKLQDYVTKFSYGNMNLSGKFREPWVSSSLRISAEGQTEFLQKLVDKRLPLSEESHTKTKEIMFIQEMVGGWKLYGKTGYGCLCDKNGDTTEVQHNWFVGYIEKGTRQIVFASHVADSYKQAAFSPFRSKDNALMHLWNLIDELEKAKNDDE